MKQFILINGPMGVGKTTVGKKLCDKLGRAAFIDGDWCLDIHPFIGNKETKSMAIKNIVYMAKNYYLSSECDSVVLSWIISEENTKKIFSQLSEMDFDLYSFVLICDEITLSDRWKSDNICEWRADEALLNYNINSLNDFSNRKNVEIIDTSNLSADNVVDIIIKKIGVLYSE